MAGIGDSAFRQDLLRWAQGEDSDEEESHGISYGNLALVSGLSLAAVLGIAYMTSNNKTSPEYQLGIHNDEIEVEEEYIPYEEDSD